MSNKAIIRITLRENCDYYIKDLKAVCHGVLPKALQMLEKHEKSESYQKYFKLINPNITKKLTKEEKEFIISMFSNILKDCIYLYEYSSEDASALNARLKVDIVDSHKDKLNNVIDFINIKLNSSNKIFLVISKNN